MQHRGTDSAGRGGGVWHGRSYVRLMGAGVVVVVVAEILQQPQRLCQPLTLPREKAIVALCTPPRLTFK